MVHPWGNLYYQLVPNICIEEFADEALDQLETSWYR